VFSPIYLYGTEQQRSELSGCVFAKWLGKSIPLKRMGTIEELSDLAVFLASDESRYITGQEIIIDGGNSIQEVKGIPQPSKPFKGSSCSTGKEGIMTNPEVHRNGHGLSC